MNGLNANDFHVAAVRRLGVQETGCEDGTIVQVWYCHVTLQFGTHDEATLLDHPSSYIPIFKVLV